jgi:arabinofuranosyltransferase
VNLIKDKRLADFYDKLEIITRGELFDSGRLAEIWNMNTGKYDDLVDSDFYRYPYDKSVGYAEVSEVKAEGTPWNRQGNVTFTDKGLRIDLGRVLHPRLMEISLDSDDVYFIVYGNGPRKYARQAIPEATKLTPANPPKRPLRQSAGLKIYRVEVPGEAAEMGFDELRIMPLAGDRSYSVGHVRFFE